MRGAELERAVVRFLGCRTELLSFEVVALLRRDERRAGCSPPAAAPTLATTSMTAADAVLDASAALTCLRTAPHAYGGRCMYVALAEALDEALRTGDQPLARAVARHTGVTVELVA